MFSSVQNRLESTLSYFGYGSKPSSPMEIPKSLENQELSTESTLQDHRIASTPPSIWKKVASLGMSYLVFSSSQSSLRETLSSGVGGYILKPWALPLTFVAGLSIFTDIAYAQSPDTTFFKVLGGATDDRGFAITTTLEGDFIVAGQTNSFGAGGPDVLLSKFSSNGTLLWANTLGGTNSDVGRALTVTPEGDVIVAGYTSSFGAGAFDVLLAKFSNNGTLVWANTLGGASSDYGYALTYTSEGDFLVTGYIGNFGAGITDMLLAKYSSNGTLVWVNTFGGPNDDLVFSITTSSMGDFFVAGYTDSFGAGDLDMLLAKFSSNGTLLWANALGGPSQDRGFTLTATFNGDLFIAGYTASFGAGSVDALVAKFSSNGTLIWANTFGEVSSDHGFALTATGEGNLIVAGETESFGLGGDDVLVTMFGNNGTLLWASTFGGVTDDRGWALTVTTEGDIIVTGYTNSLGTGDQDVLLAKLNAQGRIGNCSAWQNIIPQVQSITPTITDVTLSMNTSIPSWTVQDARSALNITDITSLMNQTTVCYEPTASSRTLATSPQTSLSSQTPSEQIQGTEGSGSISNSPSMTRSPSSTTHTPFLTSAWSSLSIKETASSTGVSGISLQSTSEITSSSIPSPSRGDTIPSITTLVYEESYPIIVNGETIGTFYFTGGSGQLDSNNTNTLNIQLDEDIEDGETITLFTIPEGEEPRWEDIVLNNGSDSGCVMTEGVFTTTSEEEHSYQLIFEYESSECSQSTATLKLAAIPVLGGGVL